MIKAANKSIKRNERESLADKRETLFERTNLCSTPSRLKIERKRVTRRETFPRKTKWKGRKQTDVFLCSSNTVFLYPIRPLPLSRWRDEKKSRRTFHPFRFFLPFRSGFRVDNRVPTRTQKTFFHGKRRRSVNTGVVVQQPFNQRAWKILFIPTSIHSNPRPLL